MATRKQRDARKKRAKAHSKAPGAPVSGTRPTEVPEIPAAFLDDQQWLAWGRASGLDLTDRDELLDAAAVGLTVLLWRNTVLEDKHAGRTPLHDDLMMRMNIATAQEVRDILDDWVPEEICQPGFEMIYDKRGCPEYISEVIEYLRDPERGMLVGLDDDDDIEDDEDGETYIYRDDILDDEWDRYQERQVFEKAGPLVRFSDLLGGRRALYQIALSGVGYAGAWYPSKVWGRAVERLHQAVQEERWDDVYVNAERDREEWPTPTREHFWGQLAHDPALLTSRECYWVMHTLLKWGLCGTVRSEDVAKMASPEDERYPVTAMLF